MARWKIRFLRGRGEWRALPRTLRMPHRRSTLGQTTDERSDKHQILLNNCSNKRRSDGKVFSTTAVAGGDGYLGADADSVAPSPVEISAPMSQYTVRHVLQAPVGGHRARDRAEDYAAPRACTGLQYE